MKISEIDKISMREFSKRDINIDGDTLSNDAINIATVGCLQRIATTLETIERHMAFNNGTLEGMTRNYDPNINRR